jgi:hypothetical protein
LKGEFLALFEQVKDSSGGFGTRIGKYLRRDVDTVTSESLVTIAGELGSMWIEMDKPGFDGEEWGYQA